MHFPFPTWETKARLRASLGDLSRQLAAARIQRTRARRQRDHAHGLLSRLRREIVLPHDLADAIDDALSDSDRPTTEAAAAPARPGGQETP